MEKKYFLLLACLYVTLQIVSTVTASKLVLVWWFIVPITTFYFPLAFVVSDIITEVYGLSKMRTVVWIALMCNIFSFMIYIFVVAYPAAQAYWSSDAYSIVFWQIPRLIVAWQTAILLWITASNYAINHLRIQTKGKYLISRLIASAIAWQWVNTVVFYTLSMIWDMSVFQILDSILAWRVFKVSVQLIVMWWTYYIINGLKKSEKVEFYLEPATATW